MTNYPDDQPQATNVEEDVEDVDEAEATTPYRFSVTSYGADYPVDGLVKRLEVRSDFARYLCILVSGYVENAVAILATAYCRERSQAPVGNYAGTQLGRLQNLNGERLGQVIGAFERSWRDELILFLDGPRKEALDSVLSLRNQIAHGESVALTFVRIQDYYSRVKEIVGFVERRFGGEA